MAGTENMATGAIRNEPLAIIGIGCRLPGGANSPAAFWKLLINGVDAVREVPKERWENSDYYHPDRSRPGKICTKYGGFLDGIDLFDAEFFGISPREASRASSETPWRRPSITVSPGRRFSSTRSIKRFRICTSPRCAAASG